MRGKVLSVYVGNIPVRIHWRWLKKITERYVRVLDVFMSKKTDVRGSRLGFIRVGSFNEATKLIHRLHGFKLMENILRADHAKANGRDQYWRKVRKGDPDDPRNEQSNIVNSNVNICSNSILKCHALEDPEVLSSLAHTVVGMANGGFDSSWLQKEINRMKNYDVIVRTAPNDQIMVEFCNLRQWEEQKGVDFVWLNEWLSNIKNWEDSLEKKERSLWLVIYGLPLSLWCFFTFENIANLWGSLISVSEKTDLRLDLRKGLIQVKSDHMHRIEKIVQIC